MRPPPRRWRRRRGWPLTWWLGRHARLQRRLPGLRASRLAGSPPARNAWPAATPPGSAAAMTSSRFIRASAPPQSWSPARPCSHKALANNGWHARAVGGQQLAQVAAGGGQRQHLPKSQSYQVALVVHAHEAAAHHRLWRFRAVGVLQQLHIAANSALLISSCRRSAGWACWPAQRWLNRCRSAGPSSRL